MMNVVDDIASAEALRGILRSYETAMNTGDFDRWISNWAADGVQLPPHFPPNVGMEAIRASNKGIFTKFYSRKMEIKSIDEVRIMPCGEYGLTRCSYSFEYVKNEGDPPTVLMKDGKALTVYKKVNGEWKIAYDCFNSNIPLS
jgi:ketosteroid isomerase-like protein